MDLWILGIVIWIFVFDRIDASTIIENQRQILKKLREINDKLKSE